MTWTIKTEYHNAKNCLDIIEKDSGGLQVAVVNKSHSQAQNNARLIAAAPEMLAMLKRLITDAERANNGDLHLVRTISDARQLINKIEGK